MTDRIVIRSYRRVFDVDQRIYRVDRWALPVPGGVPLSGVVYFAVALLTVIFLGALPLFGDLLGLLGAPMRYVILPAAAAVAGTQATPDGRPAAKFAASWVMRRWRTWRTPGPVRWSGRVRVRWDANAPRLRGCRVRGPVKVTFREPVTLRDLRTELVARRGAGEPGAVVVRGGRVVRVR